MSHKPFSFASFALFAAVATTPACGKTLALDDRPCPCASGWTCCAERNVCVADGESCPAPKDGAGATPDGGGSDAASSNAPLVLASAQSARCLATDADRVYWQNADGLVVSVPKKGGDKWLGYFETPKANNEVCGIAVHKDTVFTTSYELGKIIRETGPASAHAGEGALFGALAGPSSIAVDDDAIYVTELTGGRVTKLTWDGASVTTLASGLARPDKIAIDAANVYFVELGATKDSVDGTVKRVAKAGGDVVPLATSLTSPGGLAVAGRRLLYTTHDSVWSVDALGAPGATPSERIDGGLGLMGPVVTDGSFLFYSDIDGVHERPLAGGAGTVLDRRAVVLALATDGERVFGSTGETIFSVSR